MIEVASIVVGVLGFAFGVRSYWELRKWARQCQNARIVVAYNRRVKLNAPLVDWLTWANMLDKDESSTGRVVYMNNKTSVAVVRPGKPKDMNGYNPDKAKRVQTEA